ncbi:MAG: DUF2339 domain-containing protein [Devosia sp.]
MALSRLGGAFMYGLLGLIALGFPVAVVVLVVAAVRQSTTNRRVAAELARLAMRLEGLQRNGVVRPVGEVADAVPVVAPVTPSVVQQAVVDVPKAEPAPVPEPTPAAPSGAPAETMPPTPEDQTPPLLMPPTEPPKRFDWERFVGLRLPIWLGAIALSIAGFFFVSYAIESGFFTPEMRVLSAAAASLAFLAGAEFVRQRVKVGNAAALASALGAAAIATAYGTAYLATKTYGLVPSGAGFIVTIGVSILALAVALAYGQIVALVGIIGGYVAPVVYGGGEPNVAFFALYVIALTAVSFTVIRLKDWWRLSVVGLVGPALWGLIWMLSPPLLAAPYWGSVFLLALPLIVLVASWPGWREDTDLVSLRGFTGPVTPQRVSLASAVILAAIGFVLFLMSSDFAIGYWQGLVIFAAAAIAIGFVSPPHRALQLPILIASAAALLMWTSPERTPAFIVIGLFAIVFGFGALDQFRRLREPGLWAGVFAIVMVGAYAIALFKFAGWGEVQLNKHVWALGGLVIAAALIGLLRYFAPRIGDETQRSQVYAAWGGAVTTLVSLAVVLELDPLYFPAASALAILGLAAVHVRAPVRGLRIISLLYLVIYILLVLGAFSYADKMAYHPIYYGQIFARNLQDHALVLLVLPGLALLIAGTLFQLVRAKETSILVTAMDIVGLLVEIAGVFYLFCWPYAGTPWSDTLVLAARATAPELVIAAAAIYLGRRFDRPAALTGGIILTGFVIAAMLGATIIPLLWFWPAYAVPGTIVFNITLLAYALPAALLYFIGWHLRHDARKGIHYYGIVVSLFAVLVTYAMILVDIRQAWHLGAPTLAGDISQSEFYAYSIATLLFGLGLLVGGVAFRHRGARAVSFVFVLAATIKVFLFDASELDGLWRVLSFLLMGLSFLGISWAYARFVFGIGLQKPPEPQSGLPPP